ncbi:DsbE family thiol:disulfide interchange protein [Tanticharoenia sakaeratensis]|jgi:cytochrome c biogenesis protein CcmG, thiol:disulfide interchange protein DsbE|uniref:Thiol:disulfide interchange protein DsbE n=1 Tax=Tanticharoenia sakaeratensis NBRC 103193 TaxID=1231623 RepID=A0A0D6MHD2_9PROT|nr:DsbE family thiol:disulfide interchange protein [Tanticharoenia sakaeratensis]GAN53037.1 thiol:disulfide interchange protein DsbE precursor [Tanticharoenia sakaeratensis NBRC 103193]GBQ19708.1 cytochrome c biogenesis thiol:disulfide interchange protein DsbE [Tanticharoenia sakaeratensis NBRC 103193]
MSAQDSAHDTHRQATRRRLLTAIPLAGAGLLGIGFWRMLGHMGDGSFDPRAIDTPIIGRTVPTFALPGLGSHAGFTASELSAQGKPILLNFFASWCIPCIAEAKALQAIATRIPVWGIAYKDRPDDALGFLARDGNPFAQVAQDHDGTAAIDWGVSGVPETFLILPGGRIAWHYSGGLEPDAYERQIAPQLHRAGLPT